jgi:hypothetical protein
MSAIANIVRTLLRLKESTNRSRAPFVPLASPLAGLPSESVRSPRSRSSFSGAMSLHRKNTAVRSVSVRIESSRAVDAARVQPTRRNRRARALVSASSIAQDAPIRATCAIRSHVRADPRLHRRRDRLKIAQFAHKVSRFSEIQNSVVRRRRFVPVRRARSSARCVDGRVGHDGALGCPRSSPRIFDERRRVPRSPRRRLTRAARGRLCIESHPRRRRPRPHTEISSTWGRERRPNT